MQNDTITYTQHTREAFARGAGDAVRTGEGSRADGFVGAQKAVRARESRHASAQSSGRSMIEMLGVLAIIGVLSVGALSGYRMAMTKYRVNEMIDYAMRVVESALHHGTTQKTGDIPNAGADMCKGYVNGEEAPFDMDCAITNSAADSVPIIAFHLGEGKYSADLGTAIIKQLGLCSGATHFPCAYTTSCLSWTGNLAGKPCVRFHFKK